MKILVITFCLLLVPMAQAKTTKAGSTHHTVKASARPYRVLGHGIKSVLKDAFAAFDAAVIDPAGVGLQVVADGLDMKVAGPLEALPEPFEALGDGVHYVYKGLDKVGEQLAK